MKTPVTSSLEIALAFLQKNIDTGAWKNGDRLPTMLQLSHLANVSKNTMSAAINHLKKQNSVVAQRKSGLFLGSHLPNTFKSTDDSLPKLSHAEKLKMNIAYNIVSGKYFNQEFLPSFKEMAYTFGVGYQTLKKALELMEIDGKIYRYKRQFRIWRSGPTSGHKKIVLVHGADFVAAQESSYFRSWLYAFLNQLGKECSERNCFVVNQIYSNRFIDTEVFANSIGVIVWLNSYLKPQINDMLHFLLTLKMPVIIFEEQELLEQSIQHENLYVFGPSNVDAGYDVGTFLIHRGHRKICFLARNHESWADNRLKGVKSAFSATGLDPDSVTGLFQSDFESQKNNCSVTESFDEKLKKQNIALQKKIFGFKNEGLQVTTDAFCREKINTSLGELGFLVWMRGTFFPLFRKAQSIPGVTTWVAADDYLSCFAAIGFFNATHMKYPRDISIVGFNNMIEAFYYQLTSYDFNIPAIVGQMVDIMIKPKKKDQQHRIVVNGFIVDRGSTSQVI